MLTRDQISWNARGFTYVEIIIAVLLLAVAIVPMVSAYATGILSTSGEEATTVFTNQARGTLNRLAAFDFATLDANRGDPVGNLAGLFGSQAEADRETFTFKGEMLTPTISITDASGGVGGLLQLTVSINHVQLTTLKAQY
ncbi:MAG: hypothetical protein JSV47_12715 [Deltaproteobacteria bacterium]|nr:MAG: hypothetical protein JSV47_12715 [Deltaproteobacteria bacterium]